MRGEVTRNLLLFIPYIKLRIRDSENSWGSNWHRRLVSLVCLGSGKWGGRGRHWDLVGRGQRMLLKHLATNKKASAHSRSKSYLAPRVPAAEDEKPG